jgi:dihydropteroate synthase-like protein
MPRERLLFVTGRLAEPSLRQVLAPLADRIGFDYEVAVLGISVAALMRADWVRRKLQVPVGVQRVIVPGWCGGDLDTLTAHFGLPFVRGPKDLFGLPEFFGHGGQPPPTLEEFSIEILAEINHAPNLTPDALFQQADSYRRSGADVIDLGCVPGEKWTGIGEAVQRLICEGFRISVDSFDQFEVETAIEAGAELVLSCHQANLGWASQLPAEFVIIPDDPQKLDSWNSTIEVFEAGRQPFRLDPILEPVGFGFAASLTRYFETRRRFPEAQMLMGIGNLTELSEVDSAGVNFILAALCEELRITSILTTEVINWGRTAVREFDLARRLVHHSLKNRVLPKRIGGQLVLLRDPRVQALGDEGLKQISARLTDPNFRIFAERGEIHLMNRDGYWHGVDPYEVFDRMIASVGALTPEHAFYLGMELCKARTALTLGKQYMQDEALRWGFLTVEEISAIERRRREAGGRSMTPPDSTSALNVSESVDS